MATDPEDKTKKGPSIITLVVLAFIAIALVGYIFDNDGGNQSKEDTKSISNTSSSSNTTSTDTGSNKKIGDSNKYTICYGKMTKAHKARGFHDSNRVASINVKETVCAAYSRGDINSYEGM